MRAAPRPAPVGQAPADTPAAEAALPFPDDAVEVGRVVGAWGVAGGVKVRPLAARPDALLASRHWFLQAGNVIRPPSAPALPPVLHVASARRQAEAIVATCRGLSDRTAAEALKGARVFVARSSFPPTAEDEYYWVDLIGLEVRNRQGEPLGRVSGLIETGPQCVLCVVPSGEAAAEILIPFVAAYVDEVDLPGRMIRVDWQRGD